MIRVRYAILYPKLKRGVFGEDDVEVRPAPSSILVATIRRGICWRRHCKHT